MLWLPLQYYILGQKKRKKYLKLIQFKRLQIVEKEMTQLSHLTVAALLILASQWTWWLLQVSSGGAGGGGEAQAGGPGGDRAAVGYAQPHLHYQTMPLPLASLSPAACSLPDANAAYRPLSACQPCHTHCTCWHKVGSSTARVYWAMSVFMCM